MHSHLMALVAVACTLAGGQAVAQSQSCTGDRHILIVDRTSTLNRAEQDAFEAGIQILFQDPEFGGELMIGEVRGASLSSEWSFETCVSNEFTPSLACEDVLSRDEENTALGEDFISWAKGIVIGTKEREVTPEERLICQQERNDFEAVRLESQEQALQAVMEVSQQDVATSKTALAETIFRTIQSRCAITSCDLYIFSNLLDNGWKELVDEEGDFTAMGRQTVLEAPRFEPSESQADRVMVWGFGFNELNGEAKSALREEHAIRLENYWTGFFEEISDGSVQISFEMPR